MANPRTRRWLVGTSLSWFVFDIAYYGNTIASSTVVQKATPGASLVLSTAINFAIFFVLSLPFYFLAAYTVDRIGHRRLQIIGFTGMAAAFLLLWGLPAANSIIVLFVILYGLTYTFAQWGPNTTTFIFPAEIFPVHLRTTCHGISAGTAKIGGFIGPATLPIIASQMGNGTTFLVAGGVCALGILLTATLLPEPTGQSLEQLSDHSSVFTTTGTSDSREHGNEPPRVR